MDSSSTVGETVSSLDANWWDWKMPPPSTAYLYDVQNNRWQELIVDSYEVEGAPDYYRAQDSVTGEIFYYITGSISVPDYLYDPNENTYHQYDLFTGGFIDTTPDFLPVPNSVALFNAPSQTLQSIVIDSSQQLDYGFYPGYDSWTGEIFFYHPGDINYKGDDLLLDSAGMQCFVATDAGGWPILDDLGNPIFIDYSPDPYWV